MDGAALRLFVALPVPPAFTAQLARLTRQGVDGHWSHIDDLHITLRFLGEVRPEALPSLQEALARVRRPEFHVEVDGLGIFDTKHHPVLYARIASTRKMNALCGDITDMLTPLGFDFGQRPFVPHITLARMNSNRGLDRYVEKHGRSVAGHWPATSFGLMRSAPPDAARRRYAALAQYRLLS